MIILSILAQIIFLKNNSSAKSESLAGGLSSNVAGLRSKETRHLAVYQEKVGASPISPA